MKYNRLYKVPRGKKNKTGNLSYPHEGLPRTWIDKIPVFTYHCQTYGLRSFFVYDAQFLSHCLPLPLPSSITEFKYLNTAAFLLENAQYKLNTLLLLSELRPG